MKKIIIVLLFLLLVLPASHVAADVTWNWAWVYSQNQNDTINGTSSYRVQASAGISDYYNNVYANTVNLSRQGVWTLDEPNSYTYDYSTNSIPLSTAQMYEGTNPIVFHASGPADPVNNPLDIYKSIYVVPGTFYMMPFVDADISGGLKPTLTWNSITGADQYRFRIYNPDNQQILFDHRIYSSGASSYTYTYDEDLFSTYSNLQIYMEARDYLGDTSQLINRSRTIYSNPVPVPPSILLLGSGLIGMVGLRRRKFKK